MKFYNNRISQETWTAVRVGGRRMEGFRGFRNVPYMSRVTSRALLCLPHESLAASFVSKHTHTRARHRSTTSHKKDRVIYVSPNACPTRLPKHRASLHTRHHATNVYATCRPPTSRKTPHTIRLAGPQAPKPACPALSDSGGRTSPRRTGIRQRPVTTALHSGGGRRRSRAYLRGSGSGRAEGRAKVCLSRVC